MPNKAARESQNGSATIEFVILAMLLLFIFFAVIDFGRAYYADICLVNAAYAGAEYGALVPGQATNYSGMQTAANNDDPGTPGFTAAATGYCACAPGGASVSCGTSCAGYSAPLKYVKVQTTGSIPTLLPFPGIPSSFPLTAACILRIQ